MNKLNKAIRQLRKNFCHYINRYGVEFILFDDNSICVAGTWWIDETNDKNYIELALECNITEYGKIFGKTSLKRFQQQTPGRLLEKFKSGHIEICCSLDEPRNFFGLTFQIKNNELWAIDSANDSHKVEQCLQTPVEFMNYTKQYRLLPELITDPALKK